MLTAYVNNETKFDLDPKYTDRFEENHWFVHLSLDTEEGKEEHMIIATSVLDLVKGVENLLKLHYDDKCSFVFREADPLIEVQTRR